MPGLRDRVIIGASGVLMWGSGNSEVYIKRTESETGGTKAQDERLVLGNLISDLATMKRSVLGPPV